MELQQSSAARGNKGTRPRAWRLLPAQLSLCQNGHRYPRVAEQRLWFAQAVWEVQPLAAAGRKTWIFAHRIELQEEFCGAAVVVDALLHSAVGLQQKLCPDLVTWLR